MKSFLTKLVIMLVFFLAVWFFNPVLQDNVEQWPDWLQDTSMQFLFSMIVSFILAFNPVTASFVNSVVIKGDNNNVVQGKGDSGRNTAKIRGSGNRVKQG